MLKFIEIADTDKCRNAVIMQDSESLSYYAVFYGNFILLHKDNNGRYFEIFESLTILGSDVDKITQHIPDDIYIEVWVSGGEMAGYLDNNFSYYLDLENAIDNLKWEFETGMQAWEETDPDIYLTWEKVKRECLENNGCWGIFEQGNFEYSIYRDSVRLIDYLLAEIQ